MCLSVHFFLPVLLGSGARDILEADCRIQAVSNVSMFSLWSLIPRTYLLFPMLVVSAWFFGGGSLF